MQETTDHGDTLLPVPKDLRIIDAPWRLGDQSLEEYLSIGCEYDTDLRLTPEILREYLRQQHVFCLFAKGSAPYVPHPEHIVERRYRQWSNDLRCTSKRIIGGIIAERTFVSRKRRSRVYALQIMEMRRDIFFDQEELGATLLDALKELRRALRFACLTVFLGPDDIENHAFFARQAFQRKSTTSRGSWMLWCPSKKKK